MEWLWLLIGAIIFLFGVFTGSTIQQTATDRANKWAKGIDPDLKNK